MDVETARARQSEGWAYVDVRSPEEFAQGHPEGAINVPIGFGNGAPNERFLEVIRRQFPSTDAPLLVGCRSGARSARACELLSSAGYTAMVNVEGGMLAWDAKALPRSQAGKTWAQLTS
jgi:rhodanese-related sulfurtransferase